MLNSTKRPLPKRAFLLLIILISFSLTACADILGSGNWPGLSAHGDRVYLANGTSIAAIDIVTRQVVWTFPAEPGPGLQFYAAPAVDDERIIIGDFGASQGFFAPSVKVTIYSLANGQSDNPALLWTIDDIARDRIIAPPLLVNGRVYVGTADNELFALDAGSGQLLWQFAAGHSIWAKPVYHNEMVFVASLDKTLYALNAENGDLLWTHPLTGAIANSPAVDDERVYVGSFDKQIHALDISSGQEVWAVQADDWVWASPALEGEDLYFADIAGNVYAVDSRSGQIQWRQNVPGAVQAAPVVVNELVYIASAQTENGVGDLGAVTALARSDGRVVWQQTTRDPIFTTPVVVQDFLVVALEGEDAVLLVYGLEDGSQQWRLSPEAIN